MALQDRKGAQLALVTDRAQGGASLKSGEMEVMVHRRTLLDDERGVGEPINETMCGDYKSKCTGLIARGCHFITLQVPGQLCFLATLFTHCTLACNSKA